MILFLLLLIAILVGNALLGGWGVFIGGTIVIILFLTVFMGGKKHH